jgi:hypothetical protein
LGLLTAMSPPARPAVTRRLSGRDGGDCGPVPQGEEPPGAAASSPASLCVAFLCQNKIAGLDLRTRGIRHGQDPRLGAAEDAGGRTCRRTRRDRRTGQTSAGERLRSEMTRRSSATQVDSAFLKAWRRDERNSDALDRSCDLQGIIVQRQRSTDVDDRRSSEATGR